jgi:hypothetical protein
VEQAEEPAAEAEAERLARFGLVHQRAVVELQPLERVAQLLVLVGVRREEAGEDHRLDVDVARQRLARRPLLAGQGVADADLGDVLDAGDDVTDLPGVERRHRHHARREDADLVDLHAGAGGHQAHPLVGAKRAVDHPDEGHHATVLVVRRVEDQGPRRRRAVAFGRRHPLDDRVEHRGDALAGLGRDPQNVVGLVAEQLGDVLGHLVGIGGRQVDLVEHRDDLEVVLDRQVGVRQGLGLESLRGVDDQDRALAGGQGARDLVGEVDVPRGVDEVELVLLALVLPEDADRLGLDGDAALALELHRVEQLLAHLARRDGVGHLEDAIGERRLAVVDVRDDREVADVVELHLWVKRTASAARRVRAPRRAAVPRRWD